MTRKMKNCASTNTPLTSNAFRASPGERLHRYRCTMNWSVPCVAVVRNAPPMTPDQNVYPRVTSKAKSKTLSFPCAVRDAHDLGDPARDVLQQHDDGCAGPDKIDTELNDVCPDERGHPAQKRVDDHRHAEDQDRGHQKPHRRIGARQPCARHLVRAGQREEQRAQHQARGKEAEAVRECARGQEQARRQLLDRTAEPVAEQLVDRQHLAAEVRGHEQQADEEAAHDVAERKLEKGEVGAEGVAGDADEGDRAGLGRDNRRHHDPPGQVAIADEVVLEVALPPTEPRAKQHRAGQVGRDDREVEIRHQIRA